MEIGTKIKPRILKSLNDVPEDSLVTAYFNSVPCGCIATVDEGGKRILTQIDGFPINRTPDKMKYVP